MVSLRLIPPVKAPKTTGAVIELGDRVSEHNSYVAFFLGQIPAAKAPRVSARRAPRQREHRSAAARRASSSSATSGADPGPSDEPEPDPAGPCACGCGRDLSHKRAGARTYDAACRKRLSRGASAARIESLDAEALDEQRSGWATAAAAGGYVDLTGALDRERRELAKDRRLALARPVTPLRTEMDALWEIRWLMESDVASTGRRRGSAWWSPEFALRTRCEVVA